MRGENHCVSGLCEKRAFRSESKMKAEGGGTYTQPLRNGKREVSVVSCVQCRVCEGKDVYIKKKN